MRGAEAVAEEYEGNSENERGNDNGTCNAAENDLLLECRNCGELKLRAENEKCERDSKVCKVLENHKEGPDIGKSELDSNLLKDKGTYRNASKCRKDTDYEGVFDDIENDTDLEGRNSYELRCICCVERWVLRNWEL